MEHDDMNEKEAILKSLEEAGNRAVQGVMRFKPGQITDAWRKYTMNPIGSAAAAAALVGVPAYFMARPAARRLARLKHDWSAKLPAALAGTPEERQQALAEELEEIDSSGRGFNWRAGLGAGALAGGAALLGSYVSRSAHPTEGGWRSLLEWGKSPIEGHMTIPEFDDKSKQLRAGAGMPKEQSAGPGLPHEAALAKLAMLGGDPYRDNPLKDHPGVPVSYSLDLIWQDKYLNGKEKTNASKPFFEASDSKSGLVSTGDLVRGAMHAGFGLAGGYVAGQVLGTVFGAPKTVTQALSASGALAGILKNTGVF